MQILSPAWQIWKISTHTSMDGNAHRSTAKIWMGKNTIQIWEVPIWEQALKSSKMAPFGYFYSPSPPISLFCLIQNLAIIVELCARHTPGVGGGPHFKAPHWARSDGNPKFDLHLSSLPTSLNNVMANDHVVQSIANQKRQSKITSHHLIGSFPDFRPWSAWEAPTYFYWTWARTSPGIDFLK